MLVMAQVTIQVRSVMGGSVRVGRFDVFCFLCQTFRGTVARNALVHVQFLGCLGFAVTFNAADTRQ